ncbi:MAG: carbamoyltransferase HypF [Phycisphaeraceae bacterium]
MERRVISIRGIVQGVGFRPFVYGLASRLNLAGFTRNESWGLWVEVEGETAALDRFLSELATHHPALAQIDQIDWHARPAQGERGFHIERSVCDASATAFVAPATAFVAPDTATCDQCLAELEDPVDRRYRYPFLNCTNCGPRLTIMTAMPYDRERTTMADFVMCDACRAEYENPADRRFHAQPTACPACGPQLQLVTREGRRIETVDPLAHFVDTLRRGGIGALKGLGGYHLACDARSGTAVGELRRRKYRDEKPFALMVRDMDAAQRLCEVSDDERALLTSPRRPIVLLRRQDGADLAERVAPGNPWLGVMLPYTPLHHLLMRAVDGPMVMTSGNRCDEPIVYRDEEAIERLGDIADVLLVHDRPIHSRCDDSVTRIVAGRELPVRRSRGYAPQPIALPMECPVPGLAVGGQSKVTFALGREHHAFLSHHIGDLEHHEALRAFERDIARYQALFGIRPQWIAHDLHPGYASTRYARRSVEEHGLNPLPIQHHHAHLAACLAEHGANEPAIGVVFDGTGYGSDGTVWGGEFLIGDCHGFHRAAHLRYVGMPGGEQAIREPWRMAVAHLVDAVVGCDVLARRVPAEKLRTVERMLARDFNTPRTSSMGRLFDAVASLAGVRDRVSHEGQAAIELEWLAMRTAPSWAYPFELVETAGADSPGTVVAIDTRPLIRAVARDVRAGESAAAIARRFHSSVIEMVVAVCDRLRQSSGLNTVALSGGVFQSALLTCALCERLAEQGFRVYRHQKVPPNDGGLSLGQLVVGAARMASEAADAAHHYAQPSV